MARERPILMNGAMVRAVLDARKTQTRRALQVQPNADTSAFVSGLEGEPNRWWPTNGGDYTGPAIPCRYGAPGDRLWVRETLEAGHLGLRYAADDAEVKHEKADDLNDRYARFPPFELEPRAVPSIHMPRWASRITLEITDVRVQRLQDISEKDAEAEGVRTLRECPRVALGGGFSRQQVCRRRFCELWESINGAGAWEANPWVWAISFRRVETPA